MDDKAPGWYFTYAEKQDRLIFALSGPYPTYILACTARRDMQRDRKTMHCICSPPYEKK